MLGTMCCWVRLCVRQVSVNVCVTCAWPQGHWMVVGVHATMCRQGQHCLHGFEVLPCWHVLCAYAGEVVLMFVHTVGCQRSPGTELWRLLRITVLS